MPRYDVIFLDAQGTLLRPYPSLTSVYAEVCQQLGKPVSPSEVATALDECWAEHRRQAQGDRVVYDTSDEITREWWYRFNGTLFRRLGMGDGLSQFLESLWEVFGQPERWRLFPEVEEVLAELKRRAYRLGIVSNWDSRLLPICDGLGLSPYLDFIVASAVVGVEKPDPRIFDFALAHSQVSSQQAIHVGDDYEADVLGARGAGIDALLLDRDGASTVDGPRIRSLRELLDLLP